MRTGGIGAILIILVSLYFGIDPRLVFGRLERGGASPGLGPATRNAVPPQAQVSPQAPLWPRAPAASSSPHQAAEPEWRFVAQILTSTEDVRTSEFRSMGRQYHRPTLALFSGGTRAGCGFAQTAVGPFHCPADQRVYPDLDVFRALSRMGARGDVARASVIAQEIGQRAQPARGQGRALGRPLRRRLGQPRQPHPPHPAGGRRRGWLAGGDRRR